MKNMLAGLLILTFSCLASDLKIIIAGQSNAVGYGIGLPLPSDPNVLSWSTLSNSFVSKADTLPFFEDRTPDDGNHQSAWPTLGKLLLKNYSTIRFTGAGAGGKPISYWDVGQPGWIVLAANIRASGLDANWLVWYQGEADSIDQAHVDAYKVKLTDLFGRIRGLVDNPNLNIVVVQLEDTDNRYGTLAFLSQLKVIQYNYCANDDHAFLVQTIGCETQFDNVHLSPNGCNQLARGIAKLMLNTIVIQGPKGDKGDTGAQGPQGIKGDQGDAGSMGIHGELPTGLMFMMPHGTPPPPGAAMLKENGFRCGRNRFDLFEQH